MDRQFDFEECNFSVNEAAAQFLRVSRSYLYKLFATGGLRPTNWEREPLCEESK